MSGDSSAEDLQRVVAVAPPWRTWIMDVRSDYFNMMVGVIILVNSIIIGFETEMGDGDFVFFEHFFCIFFIVESSLRMWQLGYHEFTHDMWNLFDLSIVSIGTLELYILPLLHQHASSSLGSLRMTRLLKILRLTRVLRLLRLFRMFRSLRRPFRAFSKAIVVVFWLGVLVLVVDYIISIVLVQTIGHNSGAWGDNQHDVDLYFGSIWNSMQTLFTIMTLGDWSTCVNTMSLVLPRPLVFMCFIAYIMIASYALLSLVPGMIIEALIGMQKEEDKAKEIKFRKDSRHLQNNIKLRLRSIAGAAAHGHIKRHHVETFLTSCPDVLQKLSDLDVKVRPPQVLELFDQLADTGHVSVDIFVEAMGQFGTGDRTSLSLLELKNVVVAADTQTSFSLETILNDIADLRGDLSSIRRMFKEHGPREQAQAITDLRAELTSVRRGFRDDITSVHQDIEKMQSTLNTILSDWYVYPKDRPSPAT